MGAQLICLPYAGAGASSFRHWSRFASERLQILAPQLPGREDRFMDELHRRIPQAVEEVFAQLMQEIRRPARIILFGHSMGAILAYELARLCHAQPDIEVACLFVSGCPAPDAQRSAHASGLSDEEFVRRVVEFAGYSHPALDDPEMRELLLPSLRADVEMHERYECPREPRIAVPIVAVRGARDHLVSREDTQRWANFAESTFEYVELPGGHMYLLEAAGKLVELMEHRAVSADREALVDAS